MGKHITVTAEQVWEVLNKGTPLRRASAILGIAVKTVIKLRNSIPNPNPPGPVPITSKKKESGSPILDRIFGDWLKTPDIEVPETLLKTSPKSLSTGAYQRKLLAYFAPHVLPELMNAIRRNVRLGDVQAQKLQADILGLTPKGGGINLFMNQQNVNEARSDSEAERRVKGPTTPDEIFRMLADERDRRRLDGARGVIDLVATPMGEYEADTPIQSD